MDKSIHTPQLFKLSFVYFLLISIQFFLSLTEMRSQLCCQITIYICMIYNLPLFKNIFYVFVYNVSKYYQIFMIFDVFTPLSTGGNCTFLATTKILVSERPRPRQLSQGLGLTSVQVHDDDDGCCLCEKQPRPSSSYLEGRVAPQIKGLEKYSTLCVANNVPKKRV